MNKESKKPAWRWPPGQQRDESETRPTHRNLVEAKHGMLGTAAYRGCGAHFPEDCHLHTGVPAAERRAERELSANLSSLFLTILNAPSSPQGSLLQL